MSFKDYWKDRIKESVVKARVITEAIVFAALVITGLIVLAFTNFPAEKTVSFILLIVFGVLFIIEICFISPFKHAKTLTEKLDALEEQMKSRIKVSCGKSVDQSVVPADGETWFRARLDLKGCTPVPDIEASVVELWEDEGKVALQECLILTMYPGVMKSHDDKRTLYEGKPEFVDVIRVGDGIAHFPLKFYPRSVNHAALLKPKHTYRIIVVINSPSNRADKCTLEFKWTGDPATSDIRLISVKPPSSTRDTGASPP
jgi:hypothetical protein